MNEPIKLYMISGFLGSGKTTFLRRFLQESEGERIGAIINEFGSLGIDGKLIRSGDIDLVEINNGSIFCSCLKDGFVRTLKAFSCQPIHTLIIENSGLADPSGMRGILDGLKPYLERPYEYQGAICLVDCTSFLDYYEVLLPVQNQIAVADVIIVNKTDLADRALLEEIHAILQEANPAAATLETQYADVSIHDLRSTITARFVGKVGSAPAFIRPYTCTILCRDPQNSHSIECFLAALSPYATRAKGFVRCAEGGWMYADAIESNHSVTLVTLQDGRPTEGIVIIGRSPDDISAKIHIAWQECCQGEITLEE